MQLRKVWNGKYAIEFFSCVIYAINGYLKVKYAIF